MKKIILLAALSLFTVSSVYADVRVSDTKPEALKARNLQVVNPEIAAIEKRLAALEEENKNLKKQVEELQNKQAGSTAILNSAIVKLTKDFTGHPHSLGTRVQITGGSSFKAPGYGGEQFFLTGKLNDQNVESGSAIVK